MKHYRFLTLIVAACLSLAAMAQDQLSEAAAKAQRSLIEYLRSNDLSATIDTRDNSVNFKYKNVFYWVTFDDNGPVLYTIHRKGIKFDTDTAFKPECAMVACNAVNSKHKIKSIYKDRKVEFILQTYAKDPTDFQNGLRKMLLAFNHVDDTFKSAYDKAFDQWKADSIKNNQPIVLPYATGTSPLSVQTVSFANFDMAGNMISDYDRPMRKNNCRNVKTKVTVTSREKGLFKLAIKIYDPNGKPMLIAKGNEYAASQNIEIKKINKPEQFELPAYGTDNENFWKAGEYKVEIYDFEKGILLETVTFNLL
jgi:hypothetical protein